MIYVIEKYSNKKQISKKAKISIFIMVFIYSLLLLFLGIFIANSNSFNNIFYVKERQMLALTTKQEWKLNKKINSSIYPYEYINSYDELYEIYHDYYLKVVKKIKRTEWADDIEQQEFYRYLSNYETRKQEMIKYLFPMLNKENEYGTMINYLYPKMLIEFDRNELLTYKFMMQNSYNSFSLETIQYIFNE